MAISKRLRYEVLRRDNHTCRYCGGHAPDVVLTIDHVVPETLGGGDDPANLVTACRDCNSGKSATPPGAPLVDDVAQDALRWAEAKRLVAEQITVERVAVRHNEWAVMSVLEQYTVPSYRGGGNLADHMPGDAFQSIEQLMRQGLDVGDFMEAAEIAANARQLRPENVWRYFCGVCWSKVRQREERAAALIAAQTSPGPVEDAHPCKRGALCPAHSSDEECPWCGQRDCSFWCAWSGAMWLGERLFREEQYRISESDRDGMIIDA